MEKEKRLTTDCAILLGKNLWLENFIELIILAVGLHSAKYIRIIKIKKPK